MKNAIILHGRPDKEEYYDASYPSSSNSHWIPWLQKQLLMKDIPAATPEVPNSWNPDYALWCKEFERFDITPETILVGHSCGAGFIVRWLSDHPEVRVGKVVLVAPSLGLDWADAHFFNGPIDPMLIQRTAGVDIFVSDDDRQGIHQAALGLLAALEGSVRHDFTGYGHFVYQKMGTAEFPELLEATINV